MVKVIEYRCSACKAQLDETDTMCPKCLTINPTKLKSTKFLETEEDKKNVKVKKKKRFFKKPFIFNENYVFADMLREIRENKEQGDAFFAIMLFILFVLMIIIHIMVLGMFISMVAMWPPFLVVSILVYIIYSLI